ncbi:hypothetical protein ACEUCO_01580 [Aeromonas veronii]
MSNKAAWVSALSAVIVTALAVVQYLEKDDKVESTVQLNKQNMNVSSKINKSASVQQVIEEENTPVINNNFNCDSFYKPFSSSIKTLTYSSDRDNSYKELITKLTQKLCLNEALDAASELTYSTDRDAAYKVIYQKAIELKDFELAEITIAKLFYSTDRDKGKKVLLKAMSEI